MRVILFLSANFRGSGSISNRQVLLRKRPLKSWTLPRICLSLLSDFILMSSSYVLGYELLSSESNLSSRCRKGMSYGSADEQSPHQGSTAKQLRRAPDTAWGFSRTARIPWEIEVATLRRAEGVTNRGRHESGGYSRCRQKWLGNMRDSKMIFSCSMNYWKE